MPEEPMQSDNMRRGQRPSVCSQHLRRAKATFAVKIPNRRKQGLSPASSKLQDGALRKVAALVVYYDLARRAERSGKQRKRKGFSANIPCPRSRLGLKKEKKGKKGNPKN